MIITEEEGLACLEEAEATAFLAPHKTQVYRWPNEVCKVMTRLGWGAADQDYPFFDSGEGRRDEELMALAWAVTLSGVVCH